MKTNLIRINETEYPVPFICFWENDTTHERRSTVKILIELGYSKVVDLFSAPGEWFAIKRFEPVEDAEGNITQEPDVVTDCTDYCKLLSITDTRTGVLEVVMSKITAEEALAELREVLNG